MIKKIQEIKLAPNKSNKGKSSVDKKRMFIAKCLCGCEILVMPDLKAMNRAINKHVAEHMKVFGVSEGLREFLTEQVLIVASEHRSFK